MAYWTFSLAKRRELLKSEFKAPPWHPKTTRGNLGILLACTAVTAATQGYDTAMMGSLNIMPQYQEYFEMTASMRNLVLAIYYVGGCLACLVWGCVSDAYGRRFGLFWAAMITVVAAVLQGAAPHLAMFCTARALVGFGTTASVISGPAYLAETLPWDLRAWGLALFDDLFFVGALAAAGVTWASYGLPDSWAWRLPGLLQGVWGAACILLLPFMPESPRWLFDQGRGRAALEVLAYINANGDTRDDLVRLQFCEICDTIRYEREPLTFGQMARNPGARKRLIITMSCAFFSMITGALYCLYNIGRMLANAGIQDPNTQLKVNVGLHATNLVVSLFGSWAVDKFGVKFVAMISTAASAAFLFGVGLLNRSYGDSDYRPGVYATVSMIFLFSAAYSFGWIPILFLVPAEMLNFSIRARGMSLFSFVVNVTGIWSNFAFPAALEAIGWRMYIMNAAINLLILAFIAWFWVEVQGKTLEEIDGLFDGRKHSDVPNVEDVIRGTAEEGWRDKMADWVKKHNMNHVNLTRLSLTVGAHRSKTTPDLE